MQNIKVTFIQSDLAWKDHLANLSAFEQRIKSIEEPTDVIILPEMFNTGFVIEPESIPEGLAEEALEWMSQQASIKNCAVCGSVITKADGRFFNRFYWVQPDGQFRTYDKRHLFSLGGEDEQFTAGEKQVIINFKGWKIKPLVCYDLRFPVWAKNTYDSGVYEYDLLIYVANWPAARNHAWKSLLVARAIENQAYTIGVNRIGLDGKGTKHAGSSAVIEPKGEWISEEVQDRESIQTLELSAAAMNDYRKKFTVGLDWDQFQIS